MGIIEFWLGTVRVLRLLLFAGKFEPAAHSPQTHTHTHILHTKATEHSFFISQIPHVAAKGMRTGMESRLSFAKICDRIGNETISSISRFGSFGRLLVFGSGLARPCTRARSCVCLCVPCALLIMPKHFRCVCCVAPRLQGTRVAHFLCSTFGARNKTSSHILFATLNYVHFHARIKFKSAFGCCASAAPFASSCFSFRFSAFVSPFLLCASGRFSSHYLISSP